MSIRVKPFVGPRPFDKANSSFFYGRDREVQEIVALILSSSISLVYAKSGIGKTSIFNAKIIPELQGRRFKSHVLPTIRFKTLSTLYDGRDKPKEISNIYIFNTLLDIVEKSDTKLENEPHLKEKLAKMAISDFLKEYTVSQKEIVVDKYYHNIKFLIFDQFEEFFNIYVEDRLEQQKNFFYQIKAAINDDPNLRIVFLIREEFLASLDAFSPILPDGFRRKFRLEPLKKESAINAIEKPLLNALLLEPKLKNIINEEDIKKIADKVVKNLLKIHVQRYDGKPVVIEKTGIKKIVNKVLRKFAISHGQQNYEHIDIIGGEFVEPVQLQVVCLKLWEKKILTGKIQNEIDSIEFGDVDNALTDFYTDTVNEAKETAKTKEYSVRKWCEEELITSAGTRAIVYHDMNFTAGMSNKVIDVLQNKYLIRAEERAGSKWFELTHDRMIKPIMDSNKRWREQRAKSKRSFFIKVILPIIAISIIGVSFFAFQYEMEQQETRKNTLIAAGISLINSGNYASANADLEEALRIDPNNEVALYNKGLALDSLGNHNTTNFTKAAMQYYDKALTIDPKSPVVLFKKGQALDSLGQHTDAIKYYDRILYMKPSEPNALYNKAQALDSLGQHTDAIKYYNAYINALNSTGFDIYRNPFSGIEMVYPGNWTKSYDLPRANSTNPRLTFYPVSGASNTSLILEVYNNARGYFKLNSFQEILNSFLSGDASTKADYTRKVTIHNWHGLPVSLENVVYTEPQPIGRTQFLALKTLYQENFYNFLFFSPKYLNKNIGILRYMSNSFRILDSNQLLTPFANIIQS